MEEAEHIEARDEDHHPEAKHEDLQVDRLDCLERTDDAGPDHERGAEHRGGRPVDFQEATRRAEINR